VSERGDGLAAVLAIDGGNSKTDVALVAADGTLLAELRGPGASQEEHGVTGAMRILGGLVRSVARKAGLADDGAIVARHTSACLAGCDLPTEEEELTAALRAQGWSATAVALNDTFAVLRAGLPDDGADGSGVAVTCGAGINCVGVSPDGRTARYLALGTLTGDWGGGSGLAQAVMWHSMRGDDGRGPATGLGPAVAAHFGLETISDVVIAVHQRRLAYDDLLTVVPVLFTVAAAGDAVARSLVARQAEEVAIMAVTVMRRLDLPSRGTTVVLGGGLLQARDPLLASAMDSEFGTRAPGSILRVAEVPPVAGAALLGLDHLGIGAAGTRRLRLSFAGAETPGRDAERAKPRGLGVVLPADVGAGLRDRDAQHDPLIAFHGRAIVIPVRVLARDPPVVIDQQLHRLGQLHDLGGALDLQPLAEEPVGQHAEPDTRIAPDVPYLVRRLPGADHHVRVVIHPHRHRRELRGPVRLERGEHRVVICGYELKRLLNVHALILARRVSLATRPGRRSPTRDWLPGGAVAP
jgi:N-acetylglucosamine kinase-like BadF-type ATPase